MKFKIIFIVIFVIIGVGCRKAGFLDGAWNVKWEMSDVKFNDSTINRSKLSGGSDFNWIYYLTGNDKFGKTGDIFIEGIKIGDYKKENNKISLYINDEYSKLFGLKIDEYVGDVINDEYLSGSVSFELQGKSYTVTWQAEKF